MKIKSFTKIFNTNNNDFVYLCELKNGQSIVRSVAGNWFKIKDENIDITVLQKDLDSFLDKGIEVKGTDIIVDNSSQIINKPK